MVSAMGESLDEWREFFRTTVADVFEFINKAITIAALDRPKDFLSRRGRIAEQLFWCETARDGGDRSAETKESKVNGDAGNAVSEAVSMKYRHGEAEAFSDDTEETSRVVREVLRIKQVLDNSRHESDSTLLASLRRLRSMTVTVDTLKKTKIGVSVNSLRRNCASEQIAQLARHIIMGWKALVKEICRGTEDVAGPCNVRDRTTSSVKNQKNIRKPGQEQHDFNLAASLANRNQKLNVNKHQGIVKPNMSSNTNSSTKPRSQIASRKFEKERMLRLQNSNGSAVEDRIKCSQKVAAEMNLDATKRKMEELHRKAETDKRRRTVQISDLRDLPRMAASHEAACATTRKAHRQRVISQSQQFLRKETDVTGLVIKQEFCSL